MDTELAVQVIPNRFPSGECGRFAVSLNVHVSHCKTSTCDGAPGRIRTLNLLIRSLRPLDCRQFAVEGRGAIGAPVLVSGKCSSAVFRSASSWRGFRISPSRQQVSMCGLMAPVVVAGVAAPSVSTSIRIRSSGANSLSVKQILDSPLARCWRHPATKQSLRQGKPWREG